jgi:hypothetical protein
MPKIESGTYTGIASRVQQAFSYDRVQSQLVVTNNSTTEKIVVSVSDEERALAPSEVYTFNEEFKVFNIKTKTKTGTASFTAVSSGSVSEVKADNANQAKEILKAETNVLKVLNSTDKTHTNIMSTGLVGMYPVGCTAPTTDLGASEVVVPVPTEQYPAQKIRVSVTTNKKYLAIVKVRGITGVGTFTLLPRYGNTVTPVDEVTAPLGVLRQKTFSGASDYTTFACIFTPTNASYNSVDLTVGWDSPNKNISWAYKEPMVIDVTNLTDDDITAILISDYFVASATWTTYVSKLNDFVKTKTKTYTNMMSTDSLVSILPVGCTAPTTDSGASAVTVPASSNQYPLQKFRVNIISGHRYLFLAKVKLISGAGTCTVMSRYGGQSTATYNKVAPGVGVAQKWSWTTDYAQFANVCCPTNTSYDSVDFVIGWDSSSKNAAWAYKEVMVIDVTACTSKEIKALVARDYFATTATLTYDITHYYKDSNILFVGDSLTDAKKYQLTVNDMLGGVNITTHSKGGIGYIAMVDGDGAAENPIEALTAWDVAFQDVIVIWAGANERYTDLGELGDLYVDATTGNTIYGKVQYLINKIYTLLTTTGNLQCKIIMMTPHCCGKYSFLDIDGYGIYPVGSGRTLKTLCDAMVTVANANNIPCINLYNESGIGKNTWSIYCASPTATITAPEGATAPYPTNGDQLHLNAEAGYPLVGRMVAARINSF